MVEGSTPAVPATVRDGLPSVTVTLSTVPVCETSCASTQVTVRPIRLTALLDDRFAAIVWFATAMLVICSSVENDAICHNMAAQFMGFIGSWCWSWATKSLRKSSFPIAPLTASFGSISSVVRILGVSVLIVLMGGGSGEDVHEQPTGQL